MNDQREYLIGLFRGNMDAVTLIEDLGTVSQVWDDMIDGDVCWPHGDIINRAFMIMFVQIPRNRLYREFWGELQPIIESSVIDWMSANTLEHGGEHDKTLAFVLRDSLIGVILRLLAILEGIDYAIKAAPDVRRFFHDETYASYSAELAERSSP